MKILLIGFQLEIRVVFLEIDHAAFSFINHQSYQSFFQNVRNLKISSINLQILVCCWDKSDFQFFLPLAHLRRHCGLVCFASAKSIYMNIHEFSRPILLLSFYASPIPISGRLAGQFRASTMRERFLTGGAKIFWNGHCGCGSRWHCRFTCRLPRRQIGRLSRPRCRGCGSQWPFWRRPNRQLRDKFR